MKHSTLPALLTCTALASAASTLKTYTMTLKDADTNAPYTATIRAAPSFMKAFDRLYDQRRNLEIEITLTNWPLSYTIAEPFKITRQERTAARQFVIYDTNGNPAFSERYHLGFSLKSPLKPDLYVTCTASHNTLNTLNEVMTLCRNISLKAAK